MFRRALVPVDGSKPSLAAIGPAIQAVSPEGAILLCSVIPTVDELLIRTAASMRDSRAALELAQHSHSSREQEAWKYLQDAGRQIADTGGRVDWSKVLGFRQSSDHDPRDSVAVSPDRGSTT